MAVTLTSNVISYLDQRIEKQKGLVREAQRRFRHEHSDYNRRIAHTFEYGLNLLKGVKRAIESKEAD